MLRRLWPFAPAAVAAVALCGCSFLAGDPPAVDIASDQVARSLKNAWAPTVAVTKVSATPAGKVGAHGDTVRPQHAKSCKSDSECVIVLSALINDPKRGWIAQPQSAAEYANGTRFFAYRALRSRLSCRDLNLASRDTNRASARLSAPSTGVSAAQTAHALSLSRAVGAELRCELAARCQAAPPQTQARALWRRLAPT